MSDLLSSVTANKSPPRPEPQQIIGTTSTRSSTSSSAKDFIQPPMDVQPETKDYRSEESATEDINDENSRSADEIFRCDRCDYISASFKGLFAHKLRDHSAAGKKDKNHPNIGCLYCSQKFSAADKLVSHIKQKHRGPPKRKSIYSCKKCEFSTTTKRVFIAHRKSHNVNEEREETEVAEVSSVTVISKGSYRCPHCVFETNIEASLDIHVSQVHRGPQGSAGDFSPTIGNRQKGSPHKNQPDNNGFTVSSGKKVMNVVVPTKYADPVQSEYDRNVFFLAIL